jgi:DNA-binding SARP family transcriptional activator/tetratricopeptide (TPR) repeat protein
VKPTTLAGVAEDPVSMGTVGAMGAVTAEPGMVMAVGLLGPLQVSVAGRPVELPAGRLRPLLAVLALWAGQPVSVDRLATAVWGEDPPGDARANVQTNVKRLRRVLGTDLIVTRRGGYVLDVEPDRVDALRFVRLLDEAASAPDPATQRDRLVAALALWRGTPLEGVRSEWLEHTQVPLLQERYLAGLERRVDLDLAAGRDVGLAAELGELAARFPLRESLWARLLRVLERSGRPAEALARYEEIRACLAEELGADPGPELRQVHANLLAGGAPELTGSVRPAPADRVVPRQLPAGIDGFVGRDAELKALDSLLGNQHGSGRPVMIAAIAGPAGIGKTTLAVHWAHRVADRFPDGQLYGNLRGFDPSGHPAEPAEAIRGFLDALQVPAHRIPVSPEAQAGLYRSLLAGKRMLVLLDNARDAGQVRPLLPGAPGCLVLVTSRDQLSGLVAANGAHPLTLGLLTDDEARLLLAHRLSHDRITLEPDATKEIITRCAHLPLALAIVAARAAIHPTHPLAALAGQLRDAHGGLDLLAGEDTATDVRAVFSCSYRTLSAPAARLFRLLGLHPGPDITVGAAASLAGIPVSQARPLLADLARAHLVTEPTAGRYAFHDLLRAYASELAHTRDTGADRRAATHRMLDHYLHTAHTAALLLYRHGETVTPAAAQAGVSPETLTTRDQAMAWFTAEQSVLLAALTNAARAGFHRHTCQLASVLFIFLHDRGRWHDQAAVQQTALDDARRLGDPAEQVRAHRRLAVASADLGRYDDAHRHLRHALDLSSAMGDLVGQAWTHYYRNLVAALQGRSAEALDAAQHSLRLFQATGDRAWQAAALTDVGWHQGRLGNHRQALTLLRQALDLHQELDNRTYQAHTWSCLGDTHQQLGEPSQAIACYQRALDLFRTSGDRYAEASTLAHLGASYHTAGDPDAARAAWQYAHDMLDDLDQPAADQVRAQLHHLGQSAAEALFRQTRRGHGGVKRRGADGGPHRDTGPAISR